MPLDDAIDTTGTKFSHSNNTGNDSCHLYEISSSKPQEDTFSEAASEPLRPAESSHQCGSQALPLIPFQAALPAGLPSDMYSIRPVPEPTCQQANAPKQDKRGR